MIRLRFELEALDPVQLPAYAGSAIRGALGHGLRRTVCVTRQKACTDCLLEQTCLYPYLFEPDKPEGRSTAALQPYVLEIDPQAPRDRAAGERFHFGLVLMGKAGETLPYVVHSLDRAGAHGVGRGHGRFRVLEAYQQPAPDQDWISIYRASDGNLSLSPPAGLAPPTPPARVRVELYTPLRLKRRGRLVTPREFRTRELFWSLRHRIACIQHAFGDQDLPTPRDEIGDDQLEVDALDSDLRWCDWTRYSSRQKTYMQMGGLVGSLCFATDELGPLWPLLWAGQWVHAGKATTMGLGAYRLRDEASLQTRRAPRD